MRNIVVPAICAVVFLTITTTTTVSADGVDSIASDQNDYECTNMDSKVDYATIEQCDNIKKLKEIEALPHNWNGNGADSFKKELVDLVRNVILSISHQPEVFPTANDSIQIEYEKDNGEYLEFEFFSDEKVGLFRILPDKQEYSDDMIFSLQKIEKLVDEFYGNT